MRVSTGAYVKSAACGFRHLDRLAKDEAKAPLVHYVCGCVGYCRCGNEDKLRDEAKRKDGP